MQYLSGAFLLVTLLLLFLYARLLLRWKKGMKAVFSKEKERLIETGTELEGISVIVPFRNEKGRVEELFEDLMAQNDPRFSWEVLFVDDHSEDGGRESLSRLLEGKSELDVRVLEAGPEEEGKKLALSKGIREARFPWILTMDADCRIGKGFLERSGERISGSQADLYLLPVLYHPPGSLMEDLLYFESIALLGVLIGSAGNREPHLANGAGMIFRKELFFHHGGYEAHLEIDSGDDLFLLQEWRKAGRRIETLTDNELLIRTRYPVGMGEALEQRSRWAGKAAAFQDRTPLFSGITIAGLNMILVLNFVFSFFFFWHFLLTLISWGVKGGLDRIFLILAAKKYGNGFAWKLYPLGALLYPFQVTLIPLFRLFWQTKWKGRAVRDRR